MENPVHRFPHFTIASERTAKITAVSKADVDGEQRGWYPEGLRHEEPIAIRPACKITFKWFWSCIRNSPSPDAVRPWQGQ